MYLKLTVTNVNIPLFFYLGYKSSNPSPTVYRSLVPVKVLPYLHISPISNSHMLIYTTYVLLCKREDIFVDNGTNFTAPITTFPEKIFTQGEMKWF